jgi:uncharacterized protein (UPF0128 family)
VKARVEVECYAGYKADERPLRFRLGGHAYEVVEVVDRWYDPNATYFKVKVDDGNLYVLRHGLEEEWRLEAFRRT